MKKNGKLLTLLIVVIALLGVSGFFYVKETVKKEEIQVALEEALKKSLPGTKVDIDDLEIEYGTSVKITINKFQIDQKFPVLNYDLLKVERIRVKVPILSIFLGGGNIDIRLEAPKLFLQEKKGDKNWINAFHGKNSNKKLDKNKPSEGQAQIVLPAFLLNSTATVRMTNSLINYQLEDVSGDLNFSKLVLKNFGLNSVAAFEIQSQYKRKYLTEDLDAYSFDFTLIGAIDFAEYLKTHNLAVKTNFKVSNLLVQGKSFPLNLFRGDLNLSLSKTGAITGSVNASSSENDLYSDFNVEKGKIYFSKINATLLPKEILPFFTSDSIFNFSDTKMKITGMMDLDNGKINPNLQFDLNPFSFSFYGINPRSKAILKVLKDEITLNWEGEALQGKLASELKLNYELSSDLPIDKRVSFYAHDLKIEGLQLSDKMLIDWLERFKKAGPFNGFLLPKGLTTFSFSKVKLNESSYDGGGTLKTNGNKLTLANFSFLSAEISIKSSGDIELFEKQTVIDLKSNVKGISLGPVLKAFGEKKNVIIGSAEGEIEGHYVFSEKNDLRTTYKIKITEGELSGFGTEKLLSEVRSSMKGSLGGVSYLSYKSKVIKEFKLLEANFTLHNSILLFKGVNIVPSDKFLLSLNGSLDLKAEEETKVKVTIKDEELRKNFLKKKTRLKTLPLSLKAKGWEFESDMVQTLSQLAGKMRLKEDRKRLARKLKAEKEKDKQ